MQCRNFRFGIPRQIRRIENLSIDKGPARGRSQAKFPPGTITLRVPRVINPLASHGPSYHRAPRHLHTSAMSRVSIYLNTMGKTEEQFRFYAKVFGNPISDVMYMRDVPGSQPLPEEESHSVMHVEVEILGGTILMGTDHVASMGHELHEGNNLAINLEPDTLAEAQSLFSALSEGATDIVPLSEMFWGAHWGALKDRYGIRWMVNCAAS